MKLGAVQQFLLKLIAEGAELEHRPPKSPASQGDFTVTGKDRKARIFTFRTVRIVSEEMEAEARRLRTLLDAARVCPNCKRPWDTPAGAVRKATKKG